MSPEPHTYANTEPVIVPVVFFCGHEGAITWYRGLDSKPDEASVKADARNKMVCTDCYSARVAHERAMGLR